MPFQWSTLYSKAQREPEPVVVPWWVAACKMLDFFLLLLTSLEPLLTHRRRPSFSSLPRLNHCLSKQTNTLSACYSASVLRKAISVLLEHEKEGAQGQKQL